MPTIEALLLITLSVRPSFLVISGALIPLVYRPLTWLSSSSVQSHPISVAFITCWRFSFSLDALRFIAAELLPGKTTAIVSQDDEGQSILSSLSSSTCPPFFFSKVCLLSLLIIPISIAGLICLVVGMSPATMWITAAFASLYHVVSASGEV